MARWGGFEPPTPWFVARYSIQLSYQRVGLVIENKDAYSAFIRILSQEIDIT